MTLDLSEDQALILFEWLSRVKPGERESLIEDQAEQRTLWDIEAMLEKHLVAPFSPDYRDRLADARERVRDAEP